VTSHANTSVLALVQVAPDLLPALEGALGKVWTGLTVHVDALDGSLPEPVLAVIGGADAAEVLQRALLAEQVAPDVPFLAIVPNARILRSQRGLPPNVAWALAAEELEPRNLGLAMRCALEFGQRRKLERQLHATRVAADAGWAATAAAHEIGNPLTSLLTNLELARGQLSATVHRAEEVDLGLLLATIQDALDGARHVSRLAQDLGRASRRAGRVVPIDAKAVLDTARRLAAEPLNGVTVHMLGRRTAQVRADETRLCQVFLNLFKNAGHALAGRPKPTIEIEVEQTNTEVVVRFTDNGPGIPPESADRLFEPGFTTRAEGTGLGLALSRGFLEQMGGTLVCVPHQGGARFEVRLPAAAATGAARPTLVPDRNAASARVLVVDDAPLVRRAIERALSGAHRVTSASDIDAALADIRSNLFDVVFVDLHISGRSGIEFYEQVVERHPDRVRKFVFLSGGFGQEEIAYLDARGLPWVRKPLGADELRELVAELSAPRR
jgi:signal transduction histidine kinase/CheY-like chemotaxis protein